VAAARRSLTSTSSFERDRARESGGAELYRVPYVEPIVTHPPRPGKRVSQGRGGGLESGFYRFGIEGVLFGASLPGAGLPLGELPIVPPVSGVVVGGDADGARSRFGLSPTRPPWFESVHPAMSAVSSTNADNPDRSVLILVILPGGGAAPTP
jgi:hypothetical protein